jgi:ATP phosphoribosyltransferase
MTDKKLKIGIPNGSMVDPKRGGLKELLDKARIYTKNIGTNKPLVVTNIPWLEAAAGRPQELPSLAADGYFDVVFCGDDWAREWELRGKKTEKMLGLGTGKVDIVFAKKEDIFREVKPFKIIASEYPYLARWYVAGCGSFGGFSESAKWSQERNGYVIPESMTCIVDVGNIPEYALPGAKPGDKRNELIIVDSYGATEAKTDPVVNLAEAVVEARQSGDTLEMYMLKTCGIVMSSECSLYCREGLEEWQRKKAERIAMMLEGAVNAQGRDLVTFNVSNDALDRVVQYIRKNRLFGDEETVIPGKTMSEITLELPTRDCDKPLIDVLGDLKDLGASAIDGVPLSYSIR